MYFLERGKGREKEKERNIDVWRETWISCFSHAPTQGLAAQACALTGDQIRDLWVWGTMSNPLSHSSYGHITHF